MEKVKTYYPHIDGLKGIAIVLMVMAHVLAWSYTDTGFLSQRFCDMTPCEFNSSFVWKVIYSFHMPLLFAVSGFLFYKPIDYDWVTSKKMLLKRISRLLIPYLVTGASVYLLKGYFGYWFLQILFIVNVIAIFEFMLLHYLKADARTELITHIVLYCILFVLCRILTHLQLPAELKNVICLDGFYLAFILGILIRKFPNFEMLICRPWISFTCFLFYAGIYTLNNSSIHLPLVGALVPLLAIVYLYASCRECNFQMGGVKLSLS